MIKYLHIGPRRSGKTTNLETQARKLGAVPIKWVSRGYFPQFRGLPKNISIFVDDYESLPREVQREIWHNIPYYDFYITINSNLLDRLASQQFTQYIKEEYPEWCI